LVDENPGLETIMKFGTRGYKICGVFSRRAAVFGIGLILTRFGLKTALAIVPELIDQTEITRVRLRKHRWRVGETLRGMIQIHNVDSDTHSGNIFLCIFNDGDEVEASDVKFLQTDGDVDLNINFDDGPAPKSAGAKRFQVSTAHDSLSVDFVAEQGEEN
jgi:hypothetical protein